MHVGCKRYRIGLLAANAVQGKTIGNLNIPTVLECRVKSTKTEVGRQRCAEAKTIHGRETREARTERSLASARLAV